METDNAKSVTYAEFKNMSGLDFKNISSELYREYVYPDGSKVRIDNPVMLNVSSSGGHRIYAQAEGTTFGKCYYIKPDWRYIVWEPKNGIHFVV